MRKRKFAEVSIACDALFRSRSNAAAILCVRPLVRACTMQYFS